MSKKQFGNFDTVNIHFDHMGDRDRALRLLYDLGLHLSDHDPEHVPYREWPNSTHMIHADFNDREILYCPRPFICAAMCSGGVRFYSVGEFERIAELGFRKIPRYPVFHIPHDGEAMPYELLTDVCIPEETFMAYHNKMRDTDVRLMIPRPYVAQMQRVFPVSRLLCDVERFPGPEEVMERYGMGFCYEKAYDGTVIKHVTDAGRMRALVYYRKHHADMDRLCEKHPYMILFDMHSFSDEIVPHDFPEENHPTPDVCIGVDRKYTPAALAEIAGRRFREAGFSAEINYPYSGTFVPNAVLSGKSRCDCISVMLEINKRVYCDPNGDSIPEKLDIIQEIIRRMMTDCVEI